MPMNDKLKPVKLPMEIKFDKPPQTKFKNNLRSIRVEAVAYSTMDQLRDYIHGFVNATWAETPGQNFDLTILDKDRAIRDAFFGYTLPTVMETINITFLITGISMQEVTHILRHRQASFSADCSGDKWWTDKDALVPNSIENSHGTTSATVNLHNTDKFLDRYKDIVEKSKKLYCDMIDSRKISIMDARYILPRCLETYYYMRMPLSEVLRFIKQRIDKQIQPETDNVLAYLMYLELLSCYPIANGLINFHAPSQVYISTARQGKGTNLYFPDADSDKFEWHPDDFIYQCTRDELNGTDPGAQNLFREMLSDIKQEVAYQSMVNINTLIGEYSLHKEITEEDKEVFLNEIKGFH